MVRRSSLLTLFLLAACAAPSASEDVTHPGETPAPQPTETPTEKPAPTPVTVVGATQDGVAVVQRGTELVAIDLATKNETVLAKTKATVAVPDDAVALVADGKLSIYRSEKGFGPPSRKQWRGVMQET